MVVLGLAATPQAWAKSTTSGATVGSGHMQHCPTTVAGAKTEIKETKDAVEIAITSKDAAKTEEIRKRAKHVVDSAKAEPQSVVHNGEGHGGGGLGLCEVVLKDTTVTSEDIDGGSKITVKPNKPVDIEWLKKETQARHAANSGKKKPAAASATKTTAEQ
jgi:hypothetical protein